MLLSCWYTGLKIKFPQQPYAQKSSWLNTHEDQQVSAWTSSWLSIYGIHSILAINNCRYPACQSFSSLRSITHETGGSKSLIYRPVHYLRWRIKYRLKILPSQTILFFKLQWNRSSEILCSTMCCTSICKAEWGLGSMYWLLTGFRDVHCTQKWRHINCSQLDLPFSSCKHGHSHL